MKSIFFVIFIVVSIKEEVYMFLNLFKNLIRLRVNDSTNVVRTTT